MCPVNEGKVNEVKRGRVVLIQSNRDKHEHLVLISLSLSRVYCYNIMQIMAIDHT
jgi:hypothetical protein